MNPNTKRKALIDIAMAVLFLLLMNLTLTGVLWHEVLGVGLLLFVVLHLVVNKPWLKTTWGKLRAGQGVRRRGLVALNVFTALAMLVTMVSGVLISQYLFPALNAANLDLWITIHDVSAWLSLGLLAAHGLVHWRWIVGVVRQVGAAAGRLAGVGARVAAGLVAVCTVATVLNGQVLDAVFQSSSANSTQKTSVQANDTVLSSSSDSVGSDIIAATPTATAIVTDDSSGNSALHATDDGNTDDSAVVSTTDTTVSTPEPEPAVSLETFLSGFHCTACHRHCPLSNPRCRRAEPQIEEQTAVYEETYGTEA